MVIRHFHLTDRGRFPVLWIDPVKSIAAVYMKNSIYDGGSGAVTAANFEKDVFNSFE